MEKKNFFLVSIGIKIIITLFTLGIVCISVLIILGIAQGHIFLEVFAFILSLFLLLIVYLCFSARIIIDYEKSIVKIISLRKKCIPFSNIKNCEINTTNSINPQKYYNICIADYQDNVTMIPKYVSLGRDHLIKAKEIVNEINALNNK